MTTPWQRKAQVQAQQAKADAAVRAAQALVGRAGKA